APDGTYHYTGKNIQSSRQKLRPADDGELKVSENREKIKNRRKEENAEAQKSGSIVSGILKVVLYIVGVAVVSGIIAYNIVMVANDIFAFVKEPVEALVIIPENADIPEIARILHEKGLIKYPGIFNLYLGYRKKDKVWEYEPGAYSVSSDTNYDDLLATFRKKAAARESVRITIPEGYSIEEIISEFVDNNKIGTREGFEKVINEYDFSENYRFLKPLYETELSPDRKYRLEGYIFPDTYDFYTDESELNIIIRFLNNFNSKFTEDFYNTIDILDESYTKLTGRGITIDDIIVLASIVQWEAAQKDDFPKISAVFHNRLLAPGTYPRLESDATAQYMHLERYYDDEKEKYRFKRPVGDELRGLLESDEPYNTYKRNGVPPGAICNPGYEAMFAALWPEENSPYYFFVANTSTGEVYYGRTLAEHNDNINRARAGN
ncbi:MAG: endolytic transglycosylase MltG, partial [Oscillospiraceae bacterium]|nr:endolytic transglycosylase MltG [Oscillospiraceae bacterium]